MTQEPTPSTANEHRIIYSLSADEIQIFADHHLGRELTDSELDRFEDRFDKHLETEYVVESAQNCIDEILGNSK